MADEFSVATALPTFGLFSEKPGQSASSSLEDAAGMPRVPAPAQTSALARFVCHVCLSVVYCVLLQNVSFVVVCLSVVYCVLLRNVSHMLQKYESAHRKTAAFHIHKNTRRQGCPMSQAPCKPLFWHAWFVIVCLFVVYCVLARNTRKRTSQDSCIPHSHEKAQGKAQSLLFSFLSGGSAGCCRSGVARNRIELWFCSGDTK